MKTFSRHSLSSIAVMTAILAIAYGLDRWILFLRELNGRTASYIQPTLVSYSLAHLLLAVLLLAQFFRLIFQVPTTRWIAWLFLLVGLGISLYPAFYFTPLMEWVRLPLINLIGTRTFFITASAFIAVTGVVLLLRKQQQEVMK